jgi:hypothetical protein
MHFKVELEVFARKRSTLIYVIVFKVSLKFVRYHFIGKVFNFTVQKPILYSAFTYFNKVEDVQLHNHGGLPLI